ncbi:hypothetical protein ACFLZB_04970, partial [Nanoarchaeota archaeon]
MKYLFTNILGTFIFENDQLKDKIEFKDLADYQNKEKFEQKLTKKYKKVNTPKDQTLNHILSFFKTKKYLPQLYQRNMILTKQKIKQSISQDNLLIQAISNIKELDRIANTLAKRLREWFELYLPEFSKSVSDQQVFAKMVQEKSRKQLLKELKLTENQTMGNPLTKTDVDQMILLAKQITQTFQLREKHEQYLQKTM